MDNSWSSSKKFWILTSLAPILWRSRIIELPHTCLSRVLRSSVLLHEAVRIPFFPTEYRSYSFTERSNTATNSFSSADADVVRCFWIFTIFPSKAWSRCDVFIFLALIHEFDGLSKKWWSGVTFITSSSVWNMMRSRAGNSLFRTWSTRRK